MRRSILWTVLASALVVISNAYAQEKSPVHFGKVIPADFNVSVSHIDPNAHAVVISDVGSSSFEGNSKGWFTLVFKHQQRIKIIHQNGLDAANIQIPYYISSKSNAEEQVSNLQAITYNLENGRVVETKLESNQVFKDKLSKNWFVKKFTLPAVKAGSIIEISYTIRSDFFQNLRAWEFQGDYPILWSEYQVDIPEFFRYVFLAQGATGFHAKTNRTYHTGFNVIIDNGAQTSERVSLDAAVASNRWVMKDVPALKRETYITTTRNHVSKIEFQLAQFIFPNQPVKDVMGSWASVNKEMMENEQFGAFLKKNNNWLDDEMKLITAGATSPLDKASKIFYYLRNQFTCTEQGYLYLSDALKNIFKNKKGTDADINLLLIAMLQHEKIVANPVLLSTREHGYTNEMYPLMERFNHVVAAVQIDETIFYLDASEPLIGFGKLPLSCYNGHARLIGDQSRPVYFDADSLMERKQTSVFISKNEKGELEGSFRSKPGYYESLQLREELKANGAESYFKKIKDGLGTDLKIEHPGIDSLNLYDMPVETYFDFKFSPFEEDLLYINPMMMETMKENPFQAMTRSYPVEMPYAFDELYVLNMEVPAGYEVDELPKSARVLFNEGEGAFEYLLSHSNETVMMRSRLTMKRANFLPEEYESLREFYGYVVKKHAEQIVFKKKKK
jgi:hypothetical protein